MKNNKLIILVIFIIAFVVFSLLTYNGLKKYNDNKFAPMGGNNTINLLSRMNIKSYEYNNYIFDNVRYTTYNSYTDFWFGFISNKSDSTDILKIKIIFYDRDGTEVFSSLAEIYDISAGEYRDFDIASEEPLDNIYSFSIEDYDGTIQSYED